MERRASDRKRVNYPTVCRVPATPHPAVVEDVSYSGSRIQFADNSTVFVGATVNLDLGPRQTVSGEVVWAQPRHAGVRFYRPLPSALAIKLGLEEPLAVETVEASPIEEAGPVRSLHHWLRKLLRIAA